MRNYQNPQELFDKEYSERKNTITEIYFFYDWKKIEREASTEITIDSKGYPEEGHKIYPPNSEKIEQKGELIISEYPSLETIWNMFGEEKIDNLITSLTIKNCSQLEKIRVAGFKDIQELTVIDCPKLGELSFHDSSKLTTLNLTNCPNLKELNCPNNQLTNFDFLTDLNKEKLEFLSINNNNITSDLNPFSKFTNLKWLILDNNPFSGSLVPLQDLTKLERLEINNTKIAGSLEPLQKMNKLKVLDISNTDLNSGAEYLPDSIKEFKCSTDKRDNAEVKTIEQKFEHFNQDLKKLREFSGSAQQLLERDTSIIKDGREKWIKLNISKEVPKLEGGWWFKDFTNLKELNCLSHRLTDLDLSDCENLVELNCSENELKNLDFLKTLPHPERLEKLYIQNNSDLVAKNLDFLKPFINLKELDISDCPEMKGSSRSLESLKNLERLDVSDTGIKGSLKSLEELTKLEWLDISNTEIKEGLEYLPENVKNFYCELDYDHGSVEIAKQLSKFSEGIDEKSDHTKYDLKEWRTDQANSKTTSIVPLDRLFVIRSNIKNFADKWKKDKLDKLLPPEEWRNYGRTTECIRWTGRLATVAISVSGSALTLTGNKIEGGIVTGMGAIFPLVEAFNTKMREKYYEENKKNWEEFEKDVNNLLDNYHELVGTLEQIEKNELGEVNKALNKLKSEVGEFLKVYDKDKKKDNKTIDISTLIDKRNELGNKENSQLENIVKEIKKLEESINDYKQGKKEKNDNNELTAHIEISVAEV